MSGRRKVTKEDMPQNGLFFARRHPLDDIVKALKGIVAQVME
ncbi:hypothetical protein MSPGM_00870 [Methylorubrum sp. GM97]|jgi:hypothetical protein|nr:hypothetical protein MSPGM_00870 [Methylorubrum sp. GM97]